MSTPNTLHVLRTARLPILAQLHIEEALFRGTTNNYLLINDGVESPTIVLGISGKPEALVHQDRAKAMGVPMVKRFTGGGTVVVDEDSIMATVIIGSGARGFGIDCFPRQIMEWTHGLLSYGTKSRDGPHGGNDLGRSRGGRGGRRDPHEYHGNVQSSGLGTASHAFSLRENDFTVGSRKVGGNAQAISGDKFLQHTSFLWDYKEHRMSLLKVPEKQPAYREQREHDGFVTRLKDAFGDSTKSHRDHFIDGLIDNCTRGADWDAVVNISLDQVMDVLRRYQDPRTRPGKQVLLGSRYLSGQKLQGEYING